MRDDRQKAILIDYGCHSFTYRLATHLDDMGFPIAYFANGSLESPNLASLGQWISERPRLIRNIVCQAPYGKVGLKGRLKGEVEWAGRCIAALEKESPAAIICSTVPLVPLLRIQAWALKRGIPFVYWLQDLQGRAIHDLLGRKFGLFGKMLGNLATASEQRALGRSDLVITIADGHEKALPRAVVESGRHMLLENWANIEEIPELPADNEWSRRQGLDRTLNVVYSGTLGLKHDLDMFYALAEALKSRANARVVVVSSGQAAERVKAEAERRRLGNIVSLPFQAYEEVPQVLASAAVLVAPLERSAGSFCVPSKVLSYLCAGRPTVMSIDDDNPAARMILRAGAGIIVGPGNIPGFTEAILALLDDVALRQEQGFAARAFAEATFGMNRVVPRFLKALDLAGCVVEGYETERIAAASVVRVRTAGASRVG